MANGDALCRSPHDRVIAGVCAGIAGHFGWNATRVRVAFVVLALLGSSGIWLYLLLWLVMPAGD